MQLRYLLEPVVDRRALQTVPDVTVRDIVVSSKRAHADSLFVAMSGTTTDGHAYVDEAIARGAVAIVGDKPESDWWRRLRHRYPHVALVRVTDARGSIIQLGQRFFDDPASHLHLIGITGTNGKTTTSYLIEQLLRSNGATVGVIGTVTYRYGDRHIPSSNTTPGPLELHTLFAHMVQHRTTWCVMEVSSHALAQRRVEGIHFDSAVFTNLGSDHLDYHGTPEAYAQAKRRLFDQLNPEGRAVINIDDAYGRQLADELRRGNDHPQVMTYGRATAADIRAVQWELSWQGSRVQLHTPQGDVTLTTPLLGLHNIINCLAATACVFERPCPLDVIEEGIRQLHGVPGRMELLPGGQDVHVVIDYAHTEAAFEAAMLTVRHLQPRRLLVVFGCGGNRDRSKRPAMGRVAGRLADLVYITADNPRQEDPSVIAAAVEQGVRTTSTPYVILLDRNEAIATALAHAQPGDCVLIAGKGHEAYQLLRDTTVPFDDRRVAHRWMSAHRVTA